jgi:hypothetical protein
MAMAALASSSERIIGELLGIGKTKKFVLVLFYHRADDASLNLQRSIKTPLASTKRRAAFAVIRSADDRSIRPCECR